MGATAGGYGVDYTPPKQLGKCLGFSRIDCVIYLTKQTVCK